PQTSVFPEIAKGLSGTHGAAGTGVGVGPASARVPRFVRDDRLGFIPQTSVIPEIPKKINSVIPEIPKGLSGTHCFAGTGVLVGPASARVPRFVRDDRLGFIPPTPVIPEIPTRLSGTHGAASTVVGVGPASARVPRFVRDDRLVSFLQRLSSRKSRR